MGYTFGYSEKSNPFFIDCISKKIAHSIYQSKFFLKCLTIGSNCLKFFINVLDLVLSIHPPEYLFT